MLFLQFQIGDQRYAIAATDVTELLPMVEIIPIPRTTHGVAGLFEFRGTNAPAIDLSLLALGRPACHCLSTRLIVVGYPDEAGERRPLGLIAEKATGTVRWPPGAFVDCGIRNDQAFGIGPVATDEAGFVQRVDLARFLPLPIRDVLFRQVLPRS